MKKILCALLALSLLFVMASCSDEVKEYSLKFTQTGDKLDIACYYGDEEVPATIVYVCSDDTSFSEVVYDWEVFNEPLTLTDGGTVSALAFFPDEAFLTLAKAGTEAELVELIPDLALCSGNYKVDVAKLEAAEAAGEDKDLAEEIEDSLTEGVIVKYGTVFYETNPENWKMTYTTGLEEEAGILLLQCSELEYCDESMAGDVVGESNGKASFGVDLEDVYSAYGRDNVTASIKQGDTVLAVFNPDNNYPGLKVLPGDMVNTIKTLTVEVTVSGYTTEPVTYTQTVRLIGTLPVKAE